MNNKILNIDASLPEAIGVYLFKNRDASIIYIGKSNNLRKRVMSYFTESAKNGSKRRMIDSIDSLDYIRVSTELESLLLEDELIKQYRPQFNTKQKDFTNYRYISLLDSEYPALLNGHKPLAKEFFGPFVKPSMAKRVYELITDLLELRTCSDKVPSKSCIRRELGFCLGPCFDGTSKELYDSQMEIAIDYLRGRDSRFIEYLITKRDRLAEELNFEKAKIINDSLKLIRGYFHRQEFYRHFANNGVYVESIENGEMAFLFYRGNLLGVSNVLYSKAKVENILSNRLREYKYIDKYNKIEKYDRANIVFTWIMRLKKKRRFLYLDE